VFSRAGTGPRRRRLQHRRLGRLHACSSTGGLGHSELQLAGGVRDQRGSLGLVWVVLWLLLYQSPASHPALSNEERNYISSGTGEAPAERRDPPIADEDPQAAQLLGNRRAAFLADPTWGTLSFWLPLYLSSVRHMDLRAHRAVLPGSHSWPPISAACLAVWSPWRFKNTAGLSVIDARRSVFTLGAFLMLGVGFVGFVESPYAAIALLSLGGLCAPDSVGDR